MSETYYSDDEREAEIRDGLNRARSTLFARGDVYNFFGIRRLLSERAPRSAVGQASRLLKLQLT
jgi:hypothetical protein